MSALTAEQLAERIDAWCAAATEDGDVRRTTVRVTLVDLVAIAAHLRESAALREERDVLVKELAGYKAAASAEAGLADEFNAKLAKVGAERDALAAALREIDAAAMAAVARSDAVSDAGGPGRPPALGYSTGLNKAADIARAALARCAR